MITQEEYTRSLNIVREYRDQVIKETQAALTDSGFFKTPDEINSERAWKKYFPLMPARVHNLLMYGCSSIRICDITKEQFLSLRGAGAKSWMEFSTSTGKTSH
jgi:hypothetical protein